MSKVIEEPVKTETASATGKAAFAAARASLQAQSEDQAPAETPPPTDETSTPPPSQETEKVADETPAPTESEDTILNADELAKLTPKEREQAQKWQAKLTQKSQALSAQAKEFEQWKPLIESLTANPDAAIEELAKQRGFTIAKPNQDTAAKMDVPSEVTDAIQSLPEELRPLFQPFVKAIHDAFQKQLQPIATQQTEIISKAVAAETDGELKAFQSTHTDFNKHEPAMLKWMQRFTPAPGVSTSEYMEAAYQAVTANLSKVEQIKETVKQINKSVASVEPHTPGVPEARVEQTMPSNWSEMTSRERMRAAYDAAGKGILWKK